MKQRRNIQEERLHLFANPFGDPIIWAKRMVSPKLNYYCVLLMPFPIAVFIMLQTAALLLNPSGYRFAGVCVLLTFFAMYAMFYIRAMRKLVEELKYIEQQASDTNPEESQ